MSERTVFVSRKRLHSHRTLYLWKGRGLPPDAPELVRLEVANSTGGRALSLDLTPDEARALARALHTAAEGPPDA